MKRTKIITIVVFLLIVLSVIALLHIYPKKREPEKELSSLATDIKVYTSPLWWDLHLYLLKAKFPEEDFYQYQKTMNFIIADSQLIEKYDFSPSLWIPTINNTRLPSWWDPSEDMSNVYYNPVHTKLCKYYLMKYENGCLYYFEFVL